MPKISVIVPIYNVEEYLSECIESLLNQTFSDIEVICVNDGSTDNSLNILEKYKQKDSRIRIISQPNQGLSAARNSGLQVISGEYVTFIDSDDFLDKDTFQYVLNHSNNEDLICYGIKVFGEEHLENRSSENNYYRIKHQGHVDMPNDKLFKITDVSSCNKLFKTEIIKQNCIDFPAGLKYEDTAFYWKYVKCAKSAFFLDKYFYNYRRHSDSIMVSTFKNGKNSEDFLHICKDIYKFFIDKNILSENIKVMEDIFQSNFNNSIGNASPENVQNVLDLASKYAEEMFPNSKNRFIKNLKNKHYDKVTEPKLTFIQKILSVRNVYSTELKRKEKYLYLLGIKIKIGSARVNTKNAILITGGVGFIGSHLADLFIEKGYRVVVVDNLRTGNIKNLNKKCKLYNCDINSKKLENVFKKENIRYVYHLAAQVSVSVSEKEPDTDAKINLLGTLNVLKYCKKYNVDKFMTASSAAVYGDIEPPIKETDRPYPMSNYGISKLCMEKYIEHSGVNYIIFRFSNVYGPRQTSIGEAGVITIFNNAMKSNKPVYIYGDGNQVRDFIYVKDIAKIAYELGTSNVKNEIINVSTNKGITINQLFDVMQTTFKNYDKKPIYKDKRDADIKISILNNDKLISFINNFSFTDLKDGISELINK